MFRSVLIANRGEIAVRVIRTARRMGLRTIAVYSDADRDALHVAAADEAVRIGPAPVAASYLDGSAIISAAKLTGAEAIHPGYGFLSENADFAEACGAAGLVFIGPPAIAMRAMGLKDAAKRLMVEAGVPVVSGYHGEDQSEQRLALAAAEFGFPVLLKARAGGGGRGMRKVERPVDFQAALQSARREAKASFGDDGMIVERLIERPRHIEVQVFADAHGDAIHLFERDCSLQRRHQKVIEEAPAPGMTSEFRAVIGAAAVKAALAVGYQGAGTVEFIADASEGLRADRFYFMEMNTRLQVEHPVTEAITGLDLVRWQMRVAAGERFTRTQEEIGFRGHAIEARIYAEDPARDFAPATGRITHLALPDKVARVDTGVRAGDEITPYYDAMIAKVIVRGRDRAGAIAKLQAALDATAVAGLPTNVAFLRALLRHPDFVAGAVDTGLIGRDLARLNVTRAPDPVAVALAVLAACRLIGAGTATGDPWQDLSSWRQWGAGRSFARLEHQGAVIDAVVTASEARRYAVESVAGHTLLAVSGDAGDRVTFEAAGRRRSARVSRQGDVISVMLDGTSHLFEIASRGACSEEEQAGEDAVRSPIPGVVKVVKVAAGDTVKRGMALVVIEAMKMEHTLVAPRDGRIAEVIVAVGDIVQEGVVLVRLDG